MKKFLPLLLLVLCCAASLPIEKQEPFFIAAAPSSGGGGAFNFINSDAASAFGGSMITSGGGVDFTGSKVLTINVSKFSGSSVVSDSEGNTYTAGTATDEGDGNRINRIYYCLNPTIDPAMTFTATGSDVVITIAGFGCTGAPVIDAQATGFGSASSATFQPGSLTPGGSELFVASDTREGFTISVDAGFSDPNLISAGGSQVAGNISWKVSATAENPTFTLSQPGAGACSMVAFKVSGGGGSSPLITANLIAYYKLDDGSGTSALDASGNSHTATLSGSTLPSWITGYIGAHALSFDGSSSCVLGDSTSVTEPGSGSFAMMAWFKSTDSTANRVLAGKSGGNGTYYILELINTSGGIAAASQGEHGSSTSISDTSVNWADGNWHLAILNIDGSNQSAIVASISMDGGNFVAASDSTVGPIDPGGSFTVGQFGTSGSFFWNGSADEVGIYSATFSNAQAAALFAQTHP